MQLLVIRHVQQALACVIAPPHSNLSEVRVHGRERRLRLGERPDSRMRGLPHQGIVRDNHFIQPGSLHVRGSASGERFAPWRNNEGGMKGQLNGYYKIHYFVEYNNTALLPYH